MSYEFKEFLSKITSLDFVTTALIQYYKQFNIPMPTTNQLEEIMLDIVKINEFNNEEAKEIRNRINFILEYVSNPELQKEFEDYCKKGLN